MPIRESIPRIYLRTGNSVTKCSTTCSIIVYLSSNECAKPFLLARILTKRQDGVTVTLILGLLLLDERVVFQGAYHFLHLFFVSIHQHAVRIFVILVARAADFAADPLFRLHTFEE